MTIFYLDYELGNDANDGLSWATAWKTITNGATAARIAPADVIRIAKSPAPVSLGTTGVWTNLSKTVTLGVAQTLNIDLCEAVWTAIAGGDTTPALVAVATDAKQGDNCVRLTLDAAPQTSVGQAYYATGTLDLSAYQKISFWIKNSAAIVANNWKVCLCSDVAGATVVDTFLIPAIPSTARWLPLTLAREGGGNLGAAIQSIAIYTDTVAPTASSNILIDDFIACTAAGLNLQSLISKNSAEQGGTEGWYGIQSINGVTVLLDNDTNTKANAGRGYSGTTETVTTYKRETIKTVLASADSTQVQVVQDSGILGSNIEFQGGWNTSTTVQEGETFFDGLNGNGYGIYLNTKSYITLNYLNICRYNSGIYYNNSNNNSIITLSNANNNYYGVYYNNSNNNSIITLSNANNNNYYGVYHYNSNNNSITTLSNANNNNYSGVYYYNSNNNSIITLSNANNNYYGVYYYNSNNNSIITLSNANNNNYSGIYYNNSNNNSIITLSNVNNNDNYGVCYNNSSNNSITTLSNANNNYYGVYYNNSNNNSITLLSTTGNKTAGIYNNRGINYISNALIAEATEVTGYVAFINSRIFSNKHDQTADNHWIFTDGGTINSQATTRHTASGIAWKFVITSSNRSSSYPLDLSIAKIAVAANALVTVKVWVYKDSAAGVAAKLVCRGGQIAGVPDDVTALAADVLQTWEELTITFTPTEAGVIEIEGWGYYVTENSNVYFDDMTISQA